MENSQNNIDNIFREKFENFTPVPPEQVWDGIEKGIIVQATPTFIGRYGKPIAAAAAILIVLATALWYFIPPDDTISFTEETTPEVQQQENSGDELQINPSGQDENKEDKIVETDIETGSTTEKSGNANIEQDEYAETIPAADQPVVTAGPTKTGNQEILTPITPTEKQVALSLSSFASRSIPLKNETDVRLIEPAILYTDISLPEETSVKKGNWSMGIYFSPEVILNDFDSVEMLPTYSFNFEPTYYSNNHWFVRFGAGLSYSRDRGFADVDYISNDLMGSYDDVYEIRFDSINGELVPTYFTEDVEIWDSIPHISISQITNKYLYVQAPLLFGYHNDKNKKLRWYFYGGPAINLMVYKQIDEPSFTFENAKIVEVKNKLPERSAYYMQLWLGAGIDFKAGKNLSIALEPNYRYYFNHVFKDEPYKTSLSGFSFRIGLLYTLK